jgi:hypothetical protein
MSEKTLEKERYRKASALKGVEQPGFTVHQIRATSSSRIHAINGINEY